MNFNNYFLKTIKYLTVILLIFLSNSFIFSQEFTTNNCNSRTYSQGGWGSGNNNWQTNYLNSNFNNAFPNGLIMGCISGYTIKLTSPQAIIDFLPSGGNSNTLDQNYVNPGQSYSNTLAGQIAAVTLSVVFDAYDETFSSSDKNLGDFIFVSGPFVGKTVNEFLQMANKALGGCGDSGISLSTYTQVGGQIIANYDGGNYNDTGLLSCCTLDASISSGKIKCFGETTILNLAITNGSSNTSVQVVTSNGTYSDLGNYKYQVTAGTYTFMVRDGNCKKELSYTVNEPPKLEGTISATSILCNGETSTVSVSASGGSGSYSYLWSTGATSSSITAGAGSYSVTIKDENGCTISKEITISEPSKLMMELSSNSILCNGGKSTVTVLASGGTAPYTGTGSWDVSAGTYSYTVKDANGCEVSKEITISEPSKLEVFCTSVNAKCNGGKGSITISATGGTAPYTGTGIFDVTAGTYTYTVTDANGCSANTTCTVSEPNKLMIEVSATPILCNGGKSTVTVSATGGTAPYTGTGSWDVTAGTYTYTVTDANGCSDSSSITVTEPTALSLTIIAEKLLCYDGKVNVTANVSGGTAPYNYLWTPGGYTTQTVKLGAGTYTVTVTDAKGCIISKNVEIKGVTCDGFTTVTQGGWGAKAAGKNWGAYRDANFAAAFPLGLTVGTANRNLKLTTAKAVDDFLPSGSTSRALDRSYLNPGANYQNVFAGQVVALTLSVRFDEWDANFSTNTTKLGDLIVNSGKFAGWTVYQVLAEANKILAGESSSYSTSEMNAIVDAINNNYDNGKVNLGLLSCPCPSSSSSSSSSTSRQTTTAAKTAVVAKTAPEIAMSDEVVLYPNPSSGEINLRFDAQKDSSILVQMYNAQGSLVGDYSNKVMRNGNKASLYINNPNLAAGLYLVKVKTSTTEKTIKLLIRK